MQQLTQFLPYIGTAAAIYGAYQYFKLSHDHHSVFDTFKPGELEAFRIPTDFFPNYFQNKQGLVLHTRRYLVPNSKGLIFFCHGFTEHSSRYEGVTLELNRRGYSVFLIDHQGHGLSQGDHNFVDKFEDYSDDVIQWMNSEWSHLTSSRFQWSLPYLTIPDSSNENNPVIKNLAQNVFLFGHSMGGLISVRTALALKANPSLVPWIPFSTHPIRLILSAPALALDKSLTDVPILISISKLLSRFMPKIIVQTLPNSALSTIPIITDMASRDPIMNTNQVNARFGAEFIQSIEYAVKNASKFDFPILLMQSYKDNIVGGHDVKKWFDSISTVEDKATFLECQGFHEILFDVDREKMFSNIGLFLQNNTTTGDTHTAISKSE